MPFKLPRRSPYFSIARRMYSEQVGVYLQAWGKRGESHLL